MDIKHKRAEANLMGNLLLWKEKKNPSIQMHTYEQYDLLLPA
jgi:hypothetical protein